MLAAAGGAGIAALLAACGPAGRAAGPLPRPTAAVDRSATQQLVRWANWPAYIDYDSATGTRPTLSAFERETHLTVRYTEPIEDNVAYSNVIQPQVSRGEDCGEDLVVFTDWMVHRYILQGWLQRLDPADLPNARNLRPQLRDVDYDPGRHYSLVWQSGFGVIAWNKEKVSRPLRNVSDLWQPELAGRVEVLSEMRDTMGLILLEQGVDISQPFTDDQFAAGLAVLQQQIDSGQIRQVKGNSYLDDLVAGDALAVIGWSGDIFQLNAEHGDKFGVVVPEAGGTYWSDNLVVPIGSPHLTNAERVMNYYYDPKVAAQVAAYVNYVCPVLGAQAEMEKINPALAHSEWIFPTDEFLSHTKIFRSLGPAQDKLFSDQFQAVIGS